MTVSANVLRRSPAREIALLRAAEMASVSRATIAQFHANRLVLIYGAGSDLQVDYNMEPGRWRHVDVKASVVRHGREGILPPRAVIMNRNNRPFYIAPDVAEALIARDGDGQHCIGKPV